MENKPWLKHYPPQVSPHLDYPDAPLTHLLYTAVKDFPQQTVTIFFGAKLTYAKLWQEVNQFASALASLGVKKGDRVALMMPNCPQAVIAYFGALLIGAVVVQNNPLYVERELEFQLQDSGAETIVALDALHPRILKVMPNTPLKHAIFTGLQEYMPFPINWVYMQRMKKDGKSLDVPTAPGVLRWKDFLRLGHGEPPEVEVKPEDLALLQYTGGTTGVPKGAMLTHRNLMANTYQVMTWMLDGKRGHEKMLCALPFFHVYGMTVAMNVGIALAAELIILPKFEVKMALETIKKYQPSFFPGAPTMYVGIINFPDVARYKISSIRSCISGSAALPLEVQQTFERLTGGKLVEGYGLSESSPVTHCNPLVDSLRRNGTIGLPMPDTEVKIVDPNTQEELPVGEVGELAVKGPQVMAGYWNRPEATASALKEGWLYTGDIAQMSADGYFSIVDRKKDIIIAGGFNIYPREVEEVLYQHPAIQEVAVTGVADTYRGETVKAYLVLKPGQEASTEEIIKFSRSKLAAYKVPRQIEFRKELPKTIIGKVLKRQLQEEEKEKTKRP
ncbi:MAG: long-chain fatty acid--CoA ligase [Desulfitobacteriaceae bacterium]|nr:long-chain fatty acid--CoA ligase [Desulfitobacteriaceae bacterium]MDI6880087.1 long-chain fatty acid--CoA ligase [Desulfitobacteriaceae bacterium]MDI6913212.1 long-chain fatty acid--CoA ligase [Desulfitobacteriaceae bacterium]